MWCQNNNGEGGCGCPDCPMKESLDRGLAEMHRKYSGTNITEKHRDELFMKFFAQFEHLVVKDKLFNIASLTAQGSMTIEQWYVKIDLEIVKTEVWCLYCSQLKTMECRDTSVNRRISEDEVTQEDIKNLAKSDDSVEAVVQDELLEGVLDLLAS